MLLHDISIAHTKKARQGKGIDLDFIMHPYENSRGKGVGKFEIIRDIDDPSAKHKKISVHVTLRELAELYAHGILETYHIRLRVNSAKGDYPTPPPGKKVPAHCIMPGSDFDKMVKRIVLANQPISAGLTQELAKLNIGK